MTTTTRAYNEGVSSRNSRSGAMKTGQILALAATVVLDGEARRGIESVCGRPE
jgi:hypothetical protein